MTQKRTVSGGSLALWIVYNLYYLYKKTVIHRCYKNVHKETEPNTMRKQFFINLLLITGVCFAQNDTVPVKFNYFDINPLSLCLATLSVNYEHLFDMHNGYFIEGDYSAPLLQTMYGGVGGYRYHFSSGQKGPFLGVFIKDFYINSHVSDAWGEKYCYTLKYYAFGGHWGYRGKLSEKIKFTFRIGADYPVNTLTWDKDPPDKIGAFSKNGISNIIKLTSYIDSQLSIFIVF